jgi:hypothetical protein
MMNKFAIFVITIVGIASAQAGGHVNYVNHGGGNYHGGRAAYYGHGGYYHGGRGAYYGHGGYYHGGRYYNGHYYNGGYYPDGGFLPWLPIPFPIPVPGLY